MIETGIRFGNIHSFYDLNLILSEVSIPPAQPKTVYTDIPGMDGSLDQTEAHGEVKYEDRDGCKFLLTMNPEYDLSEAAFEAKKSEVSNLLNGIMFDKITLDKDPDFYYSGRCTVNEYLSDKRIRQIVVVARLKPYKLKHAETVRTFALSATPQTVKIHSARKPVTPIIECTDANCKVIFKNVEVTLNAGQHKVLDIRFTMGDNILQLSGTGSVTFRFQEGDL